MGKCCERRSRLSDPPLQLRPWMPDQLAPAPEYVAPPTHFVGWADDSAPHLLASPPARVSWGYSHLGRSSTSCAIRSSARCCQIVSTRCSSRQACFCVDDRVSDRLAVISTKLTLNDSERTRARRFACAYSGDGSTRSTGSRARAARQLEGPCDQPGAADRAAVHERMSIGCGHAAAQGPSVLLPETQSSPRGQSVRDYDSGGSGQLCFALGLAICARAASNSLCRACQ
jgi:hypothetical protein